MHLSSAMLLQLLVAGGSLLSAHAWLLPTTTRGPVASTTALYRQKASASSSDDDNNALIQKEAVRFLGRGPNAVVRPGCVLVAPKQEFHHYYRRAAILIYDMGPAEDVSGDYLIRGLILDHPTPFTLQEMMEQHAKVVENPLGESFLFRGGDKGDEGVILLHQRADLERPQIGLSGLYHGGWEAALALCQTEGSEKPDVLDDFKAFFNHCEFTENELSDLLDSEEDGDAWVSLEVPAAFCLNPDFDRGDAWSLLRNTITQMETPE
jgi:hypothetical protein